MLLLNGSRVDRVVMPMSHNATNWAYGLPLAGPEKSIIVALADMADEKGSCFPGHERIAGMTGWSVSTVARSMKSLERKGLIIRSRRQGKYGYRTSDRYHLQLTISLPESLPVTEPTRQRAYKAETESLPVTQPIPTSHSDGAIEPSVEPLGEPLVTYEVAEAKFQDFWNVYPRKNGKAAAEKAWAKAIKTEAPDAIVAAARLFAESPHLPAKQFVPYGATWLNGKLWNDPLPEPDEAKPTARGARITNLVDIHAQQRLLETSQTEIGR